MNKKFQVSLRYSRDLLMSTCNARVGPIAMSLKLAMFAFKKISRSDIGISWKEAELDAMEFRFMGRFAHSTDARNHVVPAKVEKENILHPDEWLISQVKKVIYDSVSVQEKAVK